MSAINEVEEDKNEKKEGLVENKKIQTEIRSAKLKLIYIGIVAIIFLIVVLGLYNCCCFEKN